MIRGMCVFGKNRQMETVGPSGARLECRAARPREGKERKTTLQRLRRHLEVIWWGNEETRGPEGALACTGRIHREGFERGRGRTEGRGRPKPLSLS